MFPELADDQIVTAIAAETRVQMISADDIAAFAVAALEDPERFAGRSIDLAAEALTMHEVAVALSTVTGRTITAVSLTPSQAIAAGRHPAMVRGEEWLNEVGYHASTDALSPYGIPLTSFGSWAATHRAQVVPANG